MIAILLLAAALVVLVTLAATVATARTEPAACAGAAGLAIVVLFMVGDACGLFGGQGTLFAKIQCVALLAALTFRGLSRGPTWLERRRRRRLPRARVVS